MSVTWKEINEVAEWVAVSWPIAPWTNKTVNVIHDRLNEGAEMLAEDVWSAIHLAFNEGTKFPPGPSELYAATQVQMRNRQSAASILASDAESVESVGFGARGRWLKSAGFKTFDEAIAHYAALEVARKEKAR